jgi:hypothetical protein
MLVLFPYAEASASNREICGGIKSGFLYTIENVDLPWHTEIFNAGEVFKVIIIRGA